MISALQTPHYVTVTGFIRESAAVLRGTFCPCRLHESTGNREGVLKCKDRLGHLSHLQRISQLGSRPARVGGKHQLQIWRQRVNTRLKYRSMSQISSQMAPDGRDEIREQGGL